jgi:hypothetical protein
MDVIGTLIEVSAFDPVTNQTVVTRMTNRNDPRATTANGQSWDPVLSSSPSVGTSVFNGAFTGAGQIDLGDFTVTLADGLADPLTRLVWDGADVKIYAGVMDGVSALPLIYRAVGNGAQRRGRLELQVSLTTRASLLEVNILTQSYAGSGQLEGDLGLKGVLKPWVFGYARYCKPVLINAAKQIWQVSAYGPIESTTNVFEGGQEVTGFDGDKDLATMLGDAGPAQGKWWRNNEHGIFRLGSQPLYQITAHVRGDTNAVVGGTALVKIGDIIGRIMALTTTATVKASSLAALNAAITKPFDDYFDSQQTVSQAMTDLLLSVGGYYTFNEGGDVIFGLVRFGQAALNLDGLNRVEPTVMGINQVPTSAPVWYLRVGAEQCHYVHDASNLPGVIAQQGADVAKAQATADAKNKTFPPSNQPPLGAVDGDQWPDTSVSPTTMRRYSSATGTWIATSNQITTANQVPYANGQTIEALRPAQAGSDVTGQNTASGIFGQGSLATLSQLGYGSPYLTGFGALAPLGSISFGSNFLLESPGGAAASLNAFKTILGIASGFTGQGIFATAPAIGRGNVFGGYFNADTFGLGSTITRNNGLIINDADAITSLGISSGFAGQGALATLNQLANGGPFLTGFGQLSSLASLAFGSPYLLESSGGSQATLSNFKTSLGIASGFTGQGALATLSTVGPNQVGFVNGGGNLIRNSSFNQATNTSTGTAGFSRYDNGYNGNTKWSRETGRIGGTAIRIYWTEASPHGKGIFLSDEGSVNNAYLMKPDQVYVFSFWAIGAGTMVGRYPYLAFNKAPAIEVIACPPLSGTSWQRYIWRLRTSADADPNIFIAMPGDTAPAWWQVDSIQLEQGEVATSYAPALLSGEIRQPLLSSDAVRLGTNIVRADGSTPATENMLVTALGVASGFTGQGIWATASALGRDSVFSGYFNANTFSFGSTITRNNGVTVTDGDAITSLGTSAAIAGQGAFATRSTVEDGFLAGNLATRLAPWTGGDARFLNAAVVAWNDGNTVENYKPQEAGGNRTETRTAAALQGQGAFATQSQINLDNTAFFNPTARFAPSSFGAQWFAASNVAWAGGDVVENYKPQEAGGNRTETRTAAALQGQGALATRNTADWGSQVDGRPLELVDGRVAAAIEGGSNALRSGIVAPGTNVGVTVPTSALLGTSPGSNIASNPEFYNNSIAGWGLYDNNGSGNVGILTAPDPTAPNSSGYILVIDYNGRGGTSPGFGGCIQSMTDGGSGSRPGKYSRGSTIYRKVIAKLPVGTALNAASNQIGDGYTIDFLTPADGTGAWREYVLRYRIGTSGAFQDTGHLFVSDTGRGSGAFQWYIARDDWIDNTASQKTYMQTGLYDEYGTARNRGDLVTNLGTSSAIVGQGAFATRSTVEDGFLAGNLASRLAPWGPDARFLNANSVAWAAGNTVESYKPEEPGGNRTEGRTAAAFQGQGSLATKSAVTDGMLSGALATRTAGHPLNGNFLTASTMAYPDGTGVNVVQPQESGSNRTETRVAAAFQGQGSLATKSKADFTDDVSGVPYTQVMSNYFPMEVWVEGSNMDVPRRSISPNVRSDTQTNSVVTAFGPGESSEPILQMISGTSGDAQGGFNCSWLTSARGFNPKDSYRYTIWVYRAPGATGTIYFGCDTDDYGVIQPWDGQRNGNPYFWAGDVPSKGKWYLIVGYLQGSGQGGGQQAGSGLYDPETGYRVQAGNDYRLPPNATYATIRAYQYYTNGSGGSASYFARPRIEKVTENMPSVSALMSNGALLNANQKWSQVGNDNGGRPYDGADVTRNNTAAAIVGQSGFATSAGLTRDMLFNGGFFNYNAFSLGYTITRSDGSTTVTESLAITSLGISAGFAGQGGLATKNNVTFNDIVSTGVITSYNGQGGRVERDGNGERVYYNNGQLAVKIGF